MGRRSTDRERKPLTNKIKVWLRELVYLLQDKPLNTITLDELAILVNKSKSTIYTYFSTKEEIYQEGIKIILEDMTYVISTEAVEGEDMELALRTIMTNIANAIEGISISFLEQIKTHHPTAWQTIEEFTTAILTNLELIYKKGMHNNTFKSFSIELLIELDRHFVMSVMTNVSKFSGHTMTLNKLVQEYIELRLSALTKN